MRFAVLPVYPSAHARDVNKYPLSSLPRELDDAIKQASAASQEAPETHKMLEWIYDIGWQLMHVVSMPDGGAGTQVYVFYLPV
jgi:hypothetical protein